MNNEILQICKKIVFATFKALELGETFKVCDDTKDVDSIRYLANQDEFYPSIPLAELDIIGLQIRIALKTENQYIFYVTALKHLEFIKIHEEDLPVEDIPKLLKHVLEEIFLPKIKCKKCDGSGEMRAHGGGTNMCDDCNGEGKIFQKKDYTD